MFAATGGTREANGGRVACRAIPDNVIDARIRGLLGNHMSTSHHSPFWDMLEQHGDHIALLLEDSSAITYSELAQRADAAGFAGLPRQLVLIELSNNVEAIAAYLGALRARHPVIIINAGNPHSAEKLVQQFRPSLHWNSGRLDAAADSLGMELHDDLCVMLSTSGSTGSSKLVRLSRDAVDANARSISEYLDISPHDRAITSLPPAYSYGLSVINSHLLAGAALALTERSVIDPHFREMMERAAVTSIACVPYTIELLESSGFFARIPASLRTITQAGGRLAAEKVLKIGQIAEEADIRFYVMYGQTEATARIAWLPPHLRDTHPDCIGRAIPRGRLWLRDPETGEESRERGELVYTGPNVMMGYAEDPSHLAAGREVTDLATGDLAERVEGVEGDIFRIVGRQSRFVKIFGLRIALDEIENQIRAKDVEATVAGSDERIVVAIRGAIPEHCGAAEIAAQYKLPEDRLAVVALTELPRLENGKVDYRAIVDLGRAPERTKGHKPFDDYKKFLQQLAAGRPLDPQSSFDSLRSDSLSFVEASIMLERALGELPSEWQTIPLASLKEMAEAAAEQHSGVVKVTFSRDTLIRLAAILTIIIGHGLGRSNTFMKGGADILILLAGYNLARYNSPRLFSGLQWTVLLDTIRRIVPILYIILAIYTVVKHPLPWFYWGFAQNYYRDTSIPFYWFLSAWMQCTVFMVVLFSIRPLREIFASNVAMASIAMLGLAIGLKFVAYTWSDPVALRFREFEQIFVFFLIGWSFYFLDKTKSQVALILLGVSLSVSAWGALNTHPILMAMALLYLAFGPRLKLPMSVAKPLQVVTLASLYIYVVGIIPSLLVWRFGEQQGAIQLALAGVHLVATIAMGIGAWWMLKLLTDWWSVAHGKMRGRWPVLAVTQRGKSIPGATTSRSLVIADKRPMRN